MAVEVREKGEERSARIRALQGMLRQMEQTTSIHALSPVVATGVTGLDGLLPRGGFPCGEVSEVTGPEGGGRMTVALLAAAAATRAGRIVAVVDAGGRLYPPAVAALGVELGRLCVVRPPAGERAAWAAEQLARSGCFQVVVFDPLHRVTATQAERLRRAAASGGAALLVIGRAEIGGWAALPSSVRLGVRPEPGGLAVTVLRARGAAPGAMVLLAVDGVSAAGDGEGAAVVPIGRGGTTEQSEAPGGQDAGDGGLTFGAQPVAPGVQDAGDGGLAFGAQRVAPGVRIDAPVGPREQVPWAGASCA